MIKNARWIESTTESFDGVKAKLPYEHPAGKRRRFDCDENCVLVWFLRGDKVLIEKRGPGCMPEVDEDIRVVAVEGRSKVTEL